jgi:hypothetical protein
MSRIAIGTTYLPQEHIHFLEEWILYYISSGVERIYLYDNDGSWGAKGWGTFEEGKDKRGYDVVSTLSRYTVDYKTIHQEILDKYSKYIVYRKWQPEDRKNPGRITLDQQLACYTMSQQAKQDGMDWLYIHDIDELFASKNGHMLCDIIQVCERNDIKCLAVSGNEYLSRYTIANDITTLREKHACDIKSTTYRLFPKPKTIQSQYCKWICDLSTFRPGGRGGRRSIHFSYSKGRKCNASSFGCSFNHYRISDTNIQIFHDHGERILYNMKDGVRKRLFERTIKDLKKTPNGFAPVEVNNLQWFSDYMKTQDQVVDKYCK